jgi:hypothetical protein
MCRSCSAWEKIGVKKIQRMRLRKIMLLNAA